MSCHLKLLLSKGRSMMTEAVPLRFGGQVIPEKQKFYETVLSYAFTNRKPVLPGHVLVSPKRVVARVSQLTTEEAADLMVCAHKVGPVLQSVYGATSLTLAVQDAGQSIDHVHMHIIPRRPGDFKNNDDIYHKLEDAKEPEKYRSLEEMAAEAAHLATFFVN